MLTQLRAERDRVQVNPSYTIGGHTERAVHSQVQYERDLKIAHGEQSLQEALHNLRQEQAFATREGLAQAHFNHQAKETIS